MDSSVFVNGRERLAILEDIEARIARNDISLERAEAIKVQACRSYSMTLIFA